MTTRASETTYGPLWLDKPWDASPRGAGGPPGWRAIAPQDRGAPGRAASWAEGVLERLQPPSHFARGPGSCRPPSGRSREGVDPHGNVNQRLDGCAVTSALVCRNSSAAANAASHDVIIKRAELWDREALELYPGLVGNIGNAAKHACFLLCATSTYIHTYIHTYRLVVQTLNGEKTRTKSGNMAAQRDRKRGPKHSGSDDI